MTVKDRLHRLVDELSEQETHTAERFLEFLRYSHDPLMRAGLAAPDDDEPETPEEAAAIEEARADMAAGRVLPHEEVRRRLLDPR
jgi:predicted transcriptional regulator